MNKLANMRNNVKKNLRADIEASQKGGRREEPHLLNYFGLKDGEKMTILFVASEQTGDIWMRYGLHGQGLRGIDRVRCPRVESGGKDKCPICDYGFEVNAEYKEKGSKDPVLRERYRAFLPKDQTVMQCVVLDSPIEINQAPDGNQVKIFKAPVGIVKTITNHIMEGQLDEDDIVTTPFIIKKTNNGGGFPSYDDSFFSRKPVSDAELESFDGKTIETWDFHSKDTPEIPPMVESDEAAKEWLEKAIKIYDAAVAAEAEGGQKPPKRGTASTGDDEAPSGRTTGAAGGLAARKAAMDNRTSVADEQKPELDHSMDDDVPDWKSEKKEEAPAKDESPASGIRARLGGLRR